jgi:hypothetical protein
MSEADELERRIEAAKGRIELQEALVVGLLKHGPDEPGRAHPVQDEVK